MSQIAENEGQFFENIPGGGGGGPSPKGEDIPIAPCLNFLRHSRFTSNFPRKIAFENVRQIISECLDYSKKGFISENVHGGAPPPDSPVEGDPYHTLHKFDFIDIRVFLPNFYGKIAFGNVRKMISECLRLQYIFMGGTTPLTPSIQPTLQVGIPGPSVTYYLRIS